MAHHDEEEEVKPKKKKGSSPLVSFFKIIISLIIFTILGIGLYLSFRSFTGIDPLKLNPERIANQFISSKTAYEFVNKLLSFKSEDSINKVKDNVADKINSSNSNSNSPLKFRFAVMGDSHKDIQSLTKGVQQAKSNGVKFIIGMGDFSDVGTEEELRNAKRVFDNNGLPYYLVPGDRDLWDARNKNLSPDYNFRNVFGESYHSFAYSNTRFIALFNSDNYFGVDDFQYNWLQDELQKTSEQKESPLFVFAAIPFYHPSSDHVMGKVTPKLKTQAELLINMLDKAKVSEVFFADTHFFSKYKEPLTGLKMTAVGAVTTDRNLQTPRFAVVDVYEDGSYNVKETEIQ